jgi:hypothetical protein
VSQIRFQRRLPDMSMPPNLTVSRAYPAPALSSKEVCRICPGPDISSHPFSAATKSFDQTYPTGSSSSIGDLWTYLIPGPNMSHPSTLTRVKSLHRTCPMPGPGSRDICRTCLAHSPDMSRSLTSQRADSLWGL